MASPGGGGGTGGGRGGNHSLWDYPCPVTSFNDLGIILSEAGGDWPAVFSNIQRAWQKWARLNRVLSREGADARTSVHIYLAVVQSVMMYGS